MRYILPIILCLGGLLVSTSLRAQPTFSMPCPVVANEGETVCIPVRVEDFTDILGMEYSITFDPDVLTFQNVTNFNPGVTGLDAADFDISDAANGTILLDWDNGTNCATSIDGVTTADNIVIYELCFEATGNFGNFSEINFGDDPLPRRITRVNSNCGDIGSFIDVGCVSVGTNPLRLIAPTITGNTGETVCVDITVEDFDNMISLQYSLNFNPNVIEFVSASPADLSNVTTSSPQPGAVAFTWFDPLAMCNSLPDGSSVVSLCFEIVGNCGNVSALTFSDDPIPQETAKCVDDAELGIVRQNGSVTVNCNDPNGLDINIPDAMVSSGENFCLDVTVGNFVNINNLNFSIVWNDALLDLTSVTTTDNLSNFNNGSLDQSQTGDGKLGVGWSAFTPFGNNLTEGHTLLTLCFEASCGGATSVSIGNDPVEIEIGKLNDDDLGLNADNSLVEVSCPPGITLIAGDAVVDPGSSVCIPVTTQNFEDILSGRFSVVWEPNILQFTGVQSFGLPGLDASDFDLSAVNFGSLCFDYESNTAVSVFDNTTLFELCFNTVGDPFECSGIVFQELPCQTEIIAEMSSGQNIGATGIDGEVCLSNPFEFSIEVGSDAGNLNEQICLPVTVENFFNISDLEFELTWDTDVLFFDDVNGTGALSNFGSSSFDATDAYTNGQIVFDYSSTSSNGESVPNGTAIFEICFLLVGEMGECSTVDISENPMTFQVTSASQGGMNIPAMAIDGEGCVNAGVAIVDVQTTPVSCPGTPDGAIDITVTGGSGFYDYLWTTSQGSFTTEDIDGVLDECVTVRVSDQLNPDQAFEQVICVGIGMGAPIVLLQADSTYFCGDLVSEICALPGSDVGPDVTLEWSAGGPGDVFQDNGECATLVGLGEFYLTATRNGCSVTDTVAFSSSTPPGASASADGAFSCLVDEVALSGTSFIESDDFEYQWIALDGGTLAPGTENDLETTATSPGRFVFEIYDPATMCTSVSDTLDLPANNTPPVAAVVDDMLMLGCDNSTQILDGTPSSTGPNFTYAWFDNNPTPFSTTVMATATAAGTYELVVTDTTNGCTASAFVEVVATTDFPTADAGPDRVLTCQIQEVTLDGSNSSQGAPGDYTYEWMNGCGAAMSSTDELTTTVTQGCTYSLRVTDNSNGCSAISFVEVTYDTLAPLVNATVDTAITCNNETLTLSATTNTDQPVWQWIAEEDNGTISSPLSQMTEVDAADTYIIMVADFDNKCVGSDTVVVEDLRTVPEIEFEPPGMLTCQVDTVTIDASSSAQGPNFVYTWDGPNCTIIDTDNPLNIRVTCDGMFTLTATDTLTGCTNFGTVMVMEDVTEPTADAGMDLVITCDVDTVTLQAGNSSQGDDFSFTWTPIGGAALIPGTETSLTPLTTTPGSYGLEVKNELNGCTDTDLVFVTDGRTEPTVEAGADQIIDCQNDAVQLTGSIDPAGDVSYQWTAGNGGSVEAGTETMPTATALVPGTYYLTGTNNANGCSATDSVIVASSTTLPIADAGADQTIGCGEDNILLDGSNSEQGTDIVYVWTTLDGTILSGADTDQLTAGGVGTYVLQVTDNGTGCMATDTVVVDFDNDLPLAVASTAGAECADSVMLIGNLPAGTTGMWQVLTSGNITDATSETTQVVGLMDGENFFVWTLSAPGCENYSNDTTSFFTSLPPLATDDEFDLILEDGDSIRVELLNNDDFDETTTVFTLLDTIAAPDLLTNFDMIGGAFTFTTGTPDEEEERSLLLRYTLCSTVCADACDTATVIINIFPVEPEPPTLDNVPNTITPNGDGLNETLYFDILDTGEYPDAEMTVFNRWGGVVWEKQPYANDFSGLNMSGEELPQGTYYYVLRLNVGGGDIVRGHVTVLR